MKSDIVKFFNMQKQIFGVCPISGALFRLTDCEIISRKIPTPDWMDELVRKEERLSRREERLDEKEEAIREKARQKGRRLATRTAKKIDQVFTPRKLNPDDAKVILHPIDYIVFNGMKEKERIKNIILLDRATKNKGHRKVQKSIEKVIERENYEWQTMRVTEDGIINIE